MMNNGMSEMDEEILKLNQRITELLTKNVILSEANQRMKNDFDRLKGEIEEHRRSVIESCQLSDKYKFDLEKEIQIREAIFEAHQKQKTKFLSLNEENYLLKERVKSLENALEHRRPSQIAGTANRSSIMASLRGLHFPDSNSRASLSHSPVRRQAAPSKKMQEIERLRKEIDELNNELKESCELINGLEFELDSIMYYEREVKDLRAKLDALTVVKPNKTNPFDSDENLSDKSYCIEPSYEELIVTESEEKNLKRIELQNKLKQFHAKHEAGTSSNICSTDSTRLASLHEQLKTL